MISPERILAKLKSLPSMPDIVARLYTKSKDPNCGSADLEAIIRTDPALTANLLRMANSAYFGLPRKVDNIRFAVTLLGSQRVFEAATGSSFARIIPQQLPGYQIDAKTYWVHCVAAAVLTERLSKELMVHTQMPFVAGLLHDIGKLAITTFLAEQSAQVKLQLDVSGLSFVDIEREVLGTDHTELGATLVDRWNLPKPLVWATRWHHDPNRLPKEADQPLVDLVHAADALAHSMGYGTDRGELKRHVAAESSKRLHLKVTQLESVVCSARPAIEDLSSIIEPAKEHGV